MRLAKFCLALALTLGIAPKTGPATANGTWRGVENIAGWEAVGRLTISGKTMCTGALVAPDLVLTAAHCLYNPMTGKKVRADRITFQAGLQNGKAKAERAVVSAAAHPQYRHRTQKGAAQVGHDLALLRLSSPIASDQVVPLAFEDRPEKGDILSVIAYTVGNRHDPQMAYPCQVVARKKATLVMNCEVDFGASGAPVFALQHGQRPYLVSVISAKAEMAGQDVSVGTSLDPSVLQLLVSNS
ncbi:trypsin-like serine peptidase [Thalassobius sp. MITS945101]|uniref:trypsin-like serine peptidase n=1 Tax=Thalassobius sp. MITS945101 TaxID=3096994 RepID=UPI00399B2CC5